MNSGSHLTDIRTNALKYRMQVPRDSESQSYGAHDQSDLTPGDE